MTNQESRNNPDREAESTLIDLEACMDGLANVIDKGMAKEVELYGLTYLEFTLLRNCLDKESTATQLAQVLPGDGARISRIVTGLVDKGLLRRRRLRNDRRIVMLRLSEEGRELTGRVISSIKSYNAMLTEGIGEEEMRVFESVTSRIVANHAAMQGSE